MAKASHALPIRSHSGNPSVAISNAFAPPRQPRNSIERATLRGCAEEILALFNSGVSSRRVEEIEAILWPELEILFDVFFKDKDRPAALDAREPDIEALLRWDAEDTADHAEQLAAASRRFAA
jgi:hypothetical protein